MILSGTSGEMHKICPVYISGGGVVGGQIQYNQRIDGREHTMENSFTKYNTVIHCLIIVIGVVV